MTSSSNVAIRQALPEEYSAIGRLLISTYAALPGMPSATDQPDYYAMLADVATRAAKPTLKILVAVDQAGKLLGSIDYIGDVAYYGSGGSASTIANAAGVRLLAVHDSARGKGVGTALTRFCIDRAKAARNARLLLHTTRVMQVAWSMYEGLGFVRFPQIDFRQGSLEVFGFCLALSSDPPR